MTSLLTVCIPCPPIGAPTAFFSYMYLNSCCSRRADLKRSLMVLDRSKTYINVTDNLKRQNQLTWKKQKALSEIGQRKCIIRCFLLFFTLFRKKHHESAFWIFRVKCSKIMIKRVCNRSATGVQWAKFLTISSFPKLTHKKPGIPCYTRA